MVAWATPTDVYNITGYVANEAEIAIAQGIVDLFSSVDSDFVDVSLIWPKDLNRLRKATAYQTKFMGDEGQFDVLSRQDVKSVSQDGLSASYQGTNGPVLAPLARVSINKLRWKRARPLHSSRRYRQGVLELASSWVRDAEPPGGWGPVT